MAEAHATRISRRNSADAVLSKSSQALIDSLIILALGAPLSPYVTRRVRALHLPCRVTPEAAAACLSRARISASERAAPWCPHVAALKADPEYSFLDFLEILASWAIFLVRDLVVRDLRERGRSEPALPTRTPAQPHRGRTQHARLAWIRSGAPG